MGRKLYLLIILSMLVSGPLFSQTEEGLALKLSPGAVIPLGETADRYLPGVSAELTGDYFLPFAPVLFLRGTLGYALSKNILTETDLSLVTFGGGLGVGLFPLQKLSIKLAGAGGYYLSLYGGGTGGSLFFSGSLDLGFRLTPSFLLGAGASYVNYVSLPDPFYEGLEVSVGVHLKPGGGSRPEMEFGDIRFDPVFPVFYKYYDDNPLGGTTVANGEKGEIENLTISLYVKQYMDNPKVCALFPSLKKGEERSVPLYALFTDSILGITEGTKVTAEIIARYTYLGEELTVSRSETLTIHNRNAMTWDDDRKAASFVTARDPAVLAFSKNIAGSIREAGSKAINGNFRLALGIFQALGLYGMGYVVDPRTPYTEYSENQFAVDYLQFPAQTLTYKAGDCDDLSILYTALLESVGIPSAFITVPGHIYTAFALDMSREEAEKTFSTPENLIFYDDNTWVPVEITMLKEDFLEAWQTGASEWRQYETEEETRILPVADSWRFYEPVGSPGKDLTILPPKSDVLLNIYLDELERFVRREISSREEYMKEKIRKNEKDPRPVNSLGVLYARFGLYEEAFDEFTKAAQADYAPALYNLGNLYLEQDDLEEAEIAYNRAKALTPSNPKALLGLAMVAYERGDFTLARSIYNNLAAMDPELAERFTYLTSGSSGGARASSATEKEVFVWDEE